MPRRKYQSGSWPGEQTNSLLVPKEMDPGRSSALLCPTVRNVKDFIFYFFLKKLTGRCISCLCRRRAGFGRHQRASVIRTERHTNSAGRAAWRVSQCSQLFFSEGKLEAYR